MATIQQEIMSIAEAQGYEGKSSGTIAEAVNALGTVMGGGGSGGGGSEPFVVTFTSGAGSTRIADKTVAEIYNAAASGRFVIGKESFHVGPDGDTPDAFVYYTLCDAQHVVYTQEGQTHEFYVIEFMCYHITTESIIGNTSWTKESRVIYFTEESDGSTTTFKYSTM